MWFGEWFPQMLLIRFNPRWHAVDDTVRSLSGKQRTAADPQQ
jgi:hypothetical protein